MATIGKADREHSGHYLSAVAVVTVVVAGMAWFSQNRTLAAAATALGLYALHLLSIRFLLDNQRRQRQVLDAQWEVLQRFIGTTDSETDDTEDLVPAMPVDRVAPERLAPSAVVQSPLPGDTPAVEAEPEPRAEPLRPAETPEGEVAQPAPEPVVLGHVVPPAESLGATDLDRANVADEEPDEALRDEENYRRPVAEVPVPRHFALGTVALVRDLLTPAEVARVLLEQRRQPGKKFGVLAVEMGLLSESQREALLLAQQEGLFTDADMRDARQRLREFRENAAHSMAGLD
jgi:type IV secretory pathway VirB10-like protein